MTETEAAAGKTTINYKSASTAVDAVASEGAPEAGNRGGGDGSGNGVNVGIDSAEYIGSGGGGNRGIVCGSRDLQMQRG